MTNLDVNEFALCVDPFEGVASVRREVVAIRSRVVGEEHETRVLGLGYVG